MGETTGGDEPTAGILASDAEPGIRVEASGFSLIGGTRIDRGPEPGPGAPTVRIRAFSLVGGVRIHRSGMSER